MESGSWLHVSKIPSVLSLMSFQLKIKNMKIDMPHQIVICITSVIKTQSFLANYPINQNLKKKSDRPTLFLLGGGGWRWLSGANKNLTQLKYKTHALLVHSVYLYACEI
jgi:hypothetical protein